MAGTASAARCTKRRAFRNWGPAGQGMRLEGRYDLGLEPMLTDGQLAIRATLDDGWTVVTADGSRSAHFEHTVVVTREGAEISDALAGAET